MALVLSIIIIFSVILKAFTHMFTLGYLPSPVLVNILPHEGVVPSVEDDFGVALLKLGTACIEATQYSGLRNELVAIQKKEGPWVEISASGSDVFDVPRTGGFGSEITKIEVSALRDPHMEGAYWKEMKAFWRACFVSLAMFGWSLLLAAPGGKKAWDMARSAYQGRWWYGPRRWKFWRRDAWAEPDRFRQQATLRRLEDTARRRAMAIDRYSQDVSVGTSTAVELRDQTPESAYAQFLRGETVEDDEEDWQDHNDTSSSSSSSSSGGEEELSLYRDLRATTEPADDLQPVLLAHLTSQSAGPLTRRRYQAILVSPSRALTPQGTQGVHDVVQDRRVTPSKERDEWDDDRRRCCVVCTIEPRDTILWPCR